MADAKKKVKSRSQWAEVWRRLVRNKGAMIGMAIVFFMVAIACSVDYIYDYETEIIAQDIMNHEEIPEEIRNAAFFKIRIHFFVGGIMNTYQQWAEGKLDCTLTEISQEIASLIQKSAMDLMDAPWLN